MQLQSAAMAYAAQPAEAGDDLCDQLGDLTGLRALVIGPEIGVMCALIRRGCSEVMERALPDRPPCSSADVVVIPTIASAAAAQCAIAHARRALVPGGQLALRMAPGLFNEVIAALTQNGLKPITVTHRVVVAKPKA